MSTQSPKLPTPKTKRKGLIFDRVNPTDFRELRFTFCCEQCSHYSRSNNECTLGYISTPHLRENQLKNYDLMGHMAFCRFLEID
jgi:hypothetical protein